MALTADEIAALVCAKPAAVRRGLEELERRKVLSKDAEDGAYFSRRMVRDERTRQARAEGGKLGGNPVLTGAKDNHKVNRKVNLGANLRSTPASASASAPEKDKDKGTLSGAVRREFEEDFALWVATLPAETRSRIKATPDRMAKYKVRRQDCERQEIQEAVQGWPFDPWPGRVEQNDFEQLLRKRAQVEKFSRLYRQNQPKPEKPREDGCIHSVTLDRWSVKQGRWVDAKDWRPGQ